MNLATQKLIFKCLKLVSVKYIYYKPAINRVRIKEVTQEECPTMAMTSNLVILYNPEFVNELIDDQAQKKGAPEDIVYRKVVGVLLHEMLHYLFKHHWRELRSPRFGILSHEAHNIAMDLEINQYIDKEDLPKNCCFVEEFKDINGNPFPTGLSYEQYLELFYQNFKDKENKKEKSNKQNNNKNENNDEKNKQNNNKNENNDEENKQNNNNKKGNDEEEKNNKKKNNDNEKKPFPSKKSRPDVNTDKDIQDDANNKSKASQGKIEEAAIDDIIRECNEEAKKRGDTSILNTELADIPKRQYKWQDVFKSLILRKSSEMKFGFNARTYEKTNRRMSALGTGIIFPANVDFVQKMNLVIGVDVSGSMYGITEKMYGMIKSIFDMQDLEIQLTILECDTQIVRVIENFKDVTNDTEIQIGRGGGTDMGAINVYVEEKKLSPDMIVIMTDNGTDWKPVKFRKQTVVLTTQITASCPYKQYWVQFPEDNN